MKGIFLRRFNEKTIAIFCVISAAFFFALMSLFLKLAGDLPVYEKSFFRNLVALLFAVGIMRQKNIPFSSGGNGNIKYLLARAVGGTIGIFCNFYAVDHLVLSDANMLNKLSPFFAVIFSFFLLKERVAPYQIGCLCLAFFGTLLILKPGFDTLVTFPAFIGMLGGLGAGFAYTNVRICSQRGVPGPFIVFFFSAFSCIASIPLSLMDLQPITPVQMLFLILTGLAACGGQFSITAAYSHAPAKEISIYDYSQILFAAGFGFLFLGEVPDMGSIAGYLVILTASAIMFCVTNGIRFLPHGA